MLRLIRTSIVMLLLLTVVTGFAYPLLVTGIATVAFPRQAGGSLVERNGVVIGSTLIGQEFSTSRWFRARPSATAPGPYNAASSSASNLGPTNPALAEAVTHRVAALRAANPTAPSGVPVDLVTASASGIDPHISPAAARWQAGRVAAARGIPIAAVIELIDGLSEGRTLGILGAPRVNVLRLNLALDASP